MTIASPVLGTPFPPLEGGVVVEVVLVEVVPNVESAEAMTARRNAAPIVEEACRATRVGVARRFSIRVERGRGEVGVGVLLDSKDERAVEEEKRDVSTVEEEVLVEVELKAVERDPEAEVVELRMRVKFATVVPTAASVNDEICSVVFPAGFVTTNVEELRRAEMELAD